MANKTLVDEIIAIIHDEANNNPAPTIAKITKTYDTNHVDLEIDNTPLTFIKCYGEPVIDSEVIVVFADGETPIAISPSNAESITIDSELSETSTNPVQNKIITLALEEKADANDIPTKTSDLTNDGEDGINVFVKNNDSRLSDARTPTSHNHGNLQNDGTITTTNTNNIFNKFLTVNNSNELLQASKLNSSQIYWSNGEDYITQENFNNSMNVHEHGNIQNNGILKVNGTTQTNKNVVTNNLGQIIAEDKPVIPTKTSDLNNDSNFISTSNTSGLIKNDGTIDTTSYSTFSGSYNDLSNKPSIPSDVSELTDTQNTPFTPKSHQHSKSDITDFPTLSTVATSGSYTDLTNKPSIPSDLSDLTDNNSIIPVDVSDLTDDYNTQFTPKTHTHSEYVNPTIADNLTTNDATQVLSAKQGKILNDLIGQAITYINQ